MAKHEKIRKSDSLNKTEKASKENWLFISILLVYSLLHWWPTRNLPYHWDSAGFVINTVVNFIDTNFTQLVGHQLGYAHPMLIPLTVALTWKIFGHTLLVSHLVMLPFLPMLLISTYYIGKKISNSYTGFLSALLVGVTPVVFVEYGLIYLDLPMSAFATLAVALWLYNKKIWSMIALSLSIWAKLPGILILPSIFIYNWVKEKEKRNPTKWNWNNYLPLIIPVIAFLAWITYHYWVTGWALIKPEVMDNLPKSNNSIQKIVHALNITFLDQTRGFMSLVLIASSLFLKSKNRLNQIITPISITLLSLLIISTIFFSKMLEYGARYSIFLIPPLAVLSVFSLLKASNNKKIVTITVAAILFYSVITMWNPKTPTQNWEFSPKKDLSYIDLIKIGQQAATYLSQNYPNAKIYGYFPENYQITQPYQGYIDQALDFTVCTEFKYIPDQTQIMYLHAYTPYQQVCKQIIEKIPSRRLKRFESNGKWLELHLFDSTASATLIPPSQ